MKTVVFALVLFVSSAAAGKELGVYKDWAAYTEGKGKNRICWIYSEPKKAEGKYTKRGRIYVVVSHRPGQKTTDEVQFTAGYTFRKDSEVRVAVDKKSFNLFTDDDAAWTRSPEEDKALVAAMRAGNRMIVTGVSSRGTRTKDTYSLAGISAAHKAIGKACGKK